MNSEPSTYMIAYENGEKRLGYYDEGGGFPWWVYDPIAHGTRYASRTEAERLAQQLRDLRVRAGRIFVVGGA